MMLLPRGTYPRVFELGAGAYDLLTAHAMWHQHALRLLDGIELPEGPLRVLDLGCGPGASALALSQALGPRARVLGLDLAANMLARARAHLARAGEPGARIDLVRADALRLPLADASVDLVTGHSFLYLVPDPRGVLSEVARVLRYGGALSLMEPRAGGSLLAAARAARPHLGQALVDPGSAARLAISMTVWRVWSAGVGRFDPARATAMLAAAGLEPLPAEPTLGGLGLLVRGRKG